MPIVQARKLEVGVGPTGETALAVTATDPRFRRKHDLVSWTRTWGRFSRSLVRPLAWF